MVPVDPESPALDGALPAPERNIPRLAQADPRALPCGMSRLLAFACGAAIIAGLASSLAGEVIMNVYKYDLIPKLTIHPLPEDLARWHNARLNSAAFTFATMGAILGLAMGLAGGLARRSVSAGATAAILGLVLGAAIAGCLALVLVPIFFKRYDPQANTLLMPLLTHGAIWSSIGAVSGLAFAVGLGARGRWIAALAGGMAGAAAATIVYEIVGAIAFAADHTDLPVSSSTTTRGMAQLLVAILAAVVAALALRQPAKRDDGGVRPVLKPGERAPAGSREHILAHETERVPMETAAPGNRPTRPSR